MTKLDTNGVALPPGSFETPATVQLSALVSHFSSYALVTYVPVPQVTSPEASGGAFQFSFSAEPDLSYTVQFSDALVPPDWQTLTNLSGLSGPVQVIDEPLTNAQRYYRVKIP